MCCHTNAEGSSRIPNLGKDISLEEVFVFLGLCIVYGILMTIQKLVANLWTKNAAYTGLTSSATVARD